MDKRATWKLSLNNKGVTLLEAVISILLISIITVGVTSLFFSLSRISKLSNEQLTMNAVMRVVKENVTESLKGDSILIGNPGINARSAEASVLEDLNIEDFNSQQYPEYKFDLEYKGTTIGTTKKYAINIKKASGESVLQFCIEIYY